MDLLAHLHPFSGSAYFWEQVVLLHDPQHSFGISVESLLFQLQPQPPVAIGSPASHLLRPEKLRQRCVRLWPAQAVDESIVAASGYGILSFVAVYHCIFYLCPHFFPMDRRKSRSSSFSIFSRLFSYLYSASVFAGFRPRLLGIPLSLIQL